MVEVSISESAYLDMLEIETYISQDSSTIARNFINKIFNKIEVLRDFPESGRIVPELNNKNSRELILGLSHCLSDKFRNRNCSIESYPWKKAFGFVIKIYHFSENMVLIGE